MDFSDYENFYLRRKDMDSEYGKEHGHSET
jgi:hypothetical protein